jgi:hypothetical protein
VAAAHCLLSVSTILRAVVLLAAAGRAADAHPHPGGIVVRADGTVLAGDILRSRLIVIETSGAWRAVRGVGPVRELEERQGIVYGVSQGTGLWMLDTDETTIPLLPDFHGLFTLGDSPSSGRGPPAGVGGEEKDRPLLLAPADALDRRPRIEILSAGGRRSLLAAWCLFQ